jgi:hypothetical protein
MLSPLGPSNSQPLHDLFDESLQEISTGIDEITNNLKRFGNTEEQNGDWEKVTKELSATLDYVESIVMLHTGLAADRNRATQRGREMLRIVHKIHWYVYFSKKQKRDAALVTEIAVKLKDLLSLARQIPTSKLVDNWPASDTPPAFLHSVYTQGNMQLLLQFLLAPSRNDHLDIVSAYYDYAHVKLLEILKASIPSMRIVANASEEASKVFGAFGSLDENAKVRHNIHCRMILGRDHAIISSADLSAHSYASHLEAGVAIERNSSFDPKTFVDQAWSGGIPVALFGQTLSQLPFQTSHIFLGLMATREQSAPIAELYRELSDDIYRLLSAQQVAGYFSSDNSMAYVNAEVMPASLTVEITRQCTLNFNEYVAVIPLKEVVDTTERDKRTQELVAGNPGNLTLLYFATGSPDGIRQAAKRTHGLASLSNPSLRFSAISLDSGKTLDDKSQFEPRSNEQYICLVHTSGLVGVSAVLTVYELQQLSIWRYLREVSGAA